MDEADDDARTFKVGFTAAGEKQFRELVREKLRGFRRGLDDTLLDYVTIMLQNGKRKDQASMELHVFLGDDSAVFVSWLWEHLSLNMHLYVQAQEQTQVVKDDEAPKEVSGKDKSSDMFPRSKCQTHSEHPIESSAATTRKRDKREWKGIGRAGNEKFPLRNVLTDILHGEEKKSQKSNEIRYPSSKQQNGRKRDRDDEPQQAKRDTSSRPMLGGGASRRLLQFAVRDAVKAVQPASTSAEPASKRLRSVVATTSAENMRDRRSEKSQDYLNDRRSERSQDNSSDRRSERTRPMLQVQGAALALRAAAEAAADSTKARSTGSVFKRLGQGNVVKQPSRSREEKRDYADFEPVTTANEHGSDRYVNNEESEEEYRELTMADRVAGMNVDSGSEDDVDRDEGVTRYQTSISHEDTFSSFAEKKTVSAQCSVELETDAIRPSSVNHEEQPVPSLTNTTSKAVSISVDVNMVEPPSYETPKDVHVVEKPYVAPMNSNATSVATNTKFRFHIAHHIRQWMQIREHFMLAMSAYVEFLHKESAERALSLNGTSFMTRILKVVRRSSHEAAHFYGWPGIGRSSLYGRHGRMAYPRAVHPGGSFRGRAPMKAGARSLQWKREPSGTDSSAGAKNDMSVPFSCEQVLPPAT
ncbi:RNA binding (RRM/RBD/RNP motifs) family protein [Zea mays]|uniref:RNA binding (RRM/RBD/RNP motifs) family protein n=1 Tax=Zea mays TaxID=4577 RepID=A0A1D6KIL3_MAIZE|nr:RNA binding (RRM/RBD/RNP motifs) family protein [Zea mays]